MSTKTLIDECIPFCTGYNRTGQRGIITKIERGQDLLFADWDGAQQEWIGTDNKGWPTYLKTTAGTYRYDVTAANLSSGSITVVVGSTTYNVRCLKVLKVFVDATNLDYTNRWAGRPYLFTWSNPYNTQTTRLDVADIAVRSRQALQGTPAQVEFAEDPGTSTDKYFIAFTWEPPRLTSESVPLIIPMLFEEALKDYVIGSIQQEQNGRMNERIQNFYKYWIPKFRQEMSSGAQQKCTETQPRIC